jgi:hypothetical protein
VSFIENYLFDVRMKGKFTVVVRSAFGLNTMNPPRVDIARGEPVQVNDLLTTLAAEKLLAASIPPAP